MHEECNHHHEITEEQEVIDLGSGKFIADKKRVALLKALNDCGLITRTHCYGHESGVSFVSILMENDLRIEVKDVNERDSTREIKEGAKEILILWDRTD